MSSKSEKSLTLNKATFFAHSYIRHNGNGTQAAMEVFDVSGSKDPRNTAHAIASCYLRKVTVQNILRKHLEKQDGILESALNFLKETMEDNTAPFKHRMKCLEVAFRIAGVEVSKSLNALAIERILSGNGDRMVTSFPQYFTQHSLSVYGHSRMKDA
jgi:hypothetical protein